MSSTPPDVLQERGRGAALRGEWSQACAAFSSALEAESLPQDLRAALLSNRSAAHLHCGRPAAALADARGCIAVRPAWCKGYVRFLMAAEALPPGERPPRELLLSLTRTALRKGGLSLFELESLRTQAGRSLLAARLLLPALSASTSGGGGSSGAANDTVALRRLLYGAFLHDLQDPALEELSHWLADRGAFCGGGRVLVNRRQVAGGAHGGDRGLEVAGAGHSGEALGGFSSGETVARLPVDCLLTLSIARAEGGLSQRCHQAGVEVDFRSAAASWLALFLLEQRALGPGVSRWWPLINALPARRGSATRRRPLAAWPLSVLRDRLAGATVALQECERFQEDVRHDYAQVLAAYGRAQLPTPPPSPEDFLWARAAVMSRVFRVGDDDVLPPFLDLINHTPAASAAHNVHWAVRSEGGGGGESSSLGGGIVVHAHRAIGPGQAILLSYGDKPNYLLLARFGFALAGNPHDVAPVSFGRGQLLDMLADPCHERMRTLLSDVRRFIRDPVRAPLETSILTGRHQEPIDAQNELAALKYIASVCDDALRGRGPAKTSVDDVEGEEGEEEQGDGTSRYIRWTVEGERAVLRAWVDLYREVGRLVEELSPGERRAFLKTLTRTHRRGEASCGRTGYLYRVWRRLLPP